VAVDFGVVAPLANPTFTGTVGGITKSMVGLGNVDNTSDVNKPISTATQTALNLKFNTADTTSLNLTSRFAAKQNTLTNPVTGTGTTNTLPLFTGTSTLGNSVIQESSGNIGIGVAPIANLTFDVAKNILLKSGSTGIASILFSETGTPSSTDVEFGGILRYNGILDRMELVTRDNLGGSNVTNTGLTMDRITGNIGLLKPTTISSSLTVTGNITEGGNNVLTNLDTASLSSRIDAKLSATDTASLSTRIDLKLNKTDTASLSSRIDAINSGGNQIAASNNTSQTIGNLSGISNYYLGITSNSTITITLPSPSLNNNKMITIKNTGTGAVNSASSNVQPLKDPTPPNTLVNTSEILVSGGGKWTTMVSNGFEWVKMAGN